MSDPIKFRSKEEAELWKQIVKIRVASENPTLGDIAAADTIVVAFRGRKP